MIVKTSRESAHHELLDIGAAAAFLQVSETSLRRWTNAGRLACYRVGGKHERRFWRADLLAFLDGRASGSYSRTDEAAGGGEREAGHLCGLYTSDLARARQAVEFLADAEPDHEVSFLVAPPDVRDRVLALLTARQPSLRAEMEAGRLVVSEYAEFAAAQLEFWDTRFAAAARAGARSLRVVGDVSSGRLYHQNTFKDVLEYELEYDRTVARRFPVATLCLYDARLLSGVETSGLFRCHGDAFRYPVEHLLS